MRRIVRDLGLPSCEIIPSSSRTLRASRSSNSEKVIACDPMLSKRFLSSSVIEDNLTPFLATSE